MCLGKGVFQGESAAGGRRKLMVSRECQILIAVLGTK